MHIAQNSAYRTQQTPNIKNIKEYKSTETKQLNSELYIITVSPDEHTV